MTKEEIEKAYDIYWPMVKDKVDNEGWVYTKEIPNLLDQYFSSATGKEIVFEKRLMDYSRGHRWRPKELTNE